LHNFENPVDTFFLTGGSFTYLFISNKNTQTNWIRKVIELRETKAVETQFSEEERQKLHLAAI